MIQGLNKAMLFMLGNPMLLGAAVLLAGVAAALLHFRNEAKAAERDMRDMAEAGVEAAEAWSDMAAARKELGEGMGLQADVRALEKMVEAQSALVEIQKERLTDLHGQGKRVGDPLVDAEIEDTKKKVELLKRTAAELQTARDKLRANNTTTREVETTELTKEQLAEQKKLTEEVDKMTASLEFAAVSWGKSSAEAKIMEMRAKGVSEEILVGLEALQRTLEVQKEFDEEFDRNLSVLNEEAQLRATARDSRRSEAEELREMLLTKEQILAAELARVDALVLTNDLTAKEAEQIKAKIEKEAAERDKKKEERRAVQLSSLTQAANRITIAAAGRTSTSPQGPPQPPPGGTPTKETADKTLVAIEEIKAGIDTIVKSLPLGGMVA